MILSKFQIRNNNAHKVLTEYETNLDDNFEIFYIIFFCRNQLPNQSTALIELGGFKAFAGHFLVRHDRIKQWFVDILIYIERRLNWILQMAAGRNCECGRVCVWTCACTDTQEGTLTCHFFSHTHTHTHTYTHTTSRAKCRTSRWNRVRLLQWPQTTLLNHNPKFNLHLHPLIIKRPLIRPIKSLPHLYLRLQHITHPHLNQCKSQMWAQWLNRC